MNFGIFTALITPFDQKGNIDIDGFLFHLKRQREAGVDGVVVLGTTGEATTLSMQEKKTLIKIARKETSLQLMVGCSSSSTAQTIENIQVAADFGADSILVSSPFYTKPTQEGLFRHYEEVSRVNSIPIIAYNNPSRTGVNIEIETLQRIANLPGICGIKESSEDIPQICDIFYTIKKERPDFAVICGDDILTFVVMALGGDGVISGGANLIPNQIVSMIQFFKQGQFEKARNCNLNLMPIFNALRSESNPIPLKAALQLLGLPSGSPRLPLTSLNPRYMPNLERALQIINPSQ